LEEAFTFLEMPYLWDWRKGVVLKIDQETPWNTAILNYIMAGAPNTFSASPKIAPGGFKPVTIAIGEYGFGAVSSAWASLRASHGARCYSGF
jgi:hypothetical protein